MKNVRMRTLTKTIDAKLDLTLSHKQKEHVDPLKGENL